MIWASASFLALERPATAQADRWSEEATGPTGMDSGGALASAGSGFLYAFEGNSASFWRYSTTANTWVALAPAPGNVSHGGSLVYPSAGDFMYALRGGGNSDFWRYSISADTWTPMASAPDNVDSGGDLVYPGTGDYVYATGGAGSRNFWRYSISGNTWTTVANTPDNVGVGGSLETDGGGEFIYATRGDGSTAFWRYSISGNTWTLMASTPDEIGVGSDLVYPGNGDFLYALRGDGSRSFWRYSLGGNSWGAISNAPAQGGPGAALAHPGSGDFIFGLRGDGTAEFWRYSISAESWTQPDPVPALVGPGGGLAGFGGNKVYCLQGNFTANFNRYETDTDTWTALSPAPGVVGDGGALVYPDTGNHLYAVRGASTTSFWRFSTSTQLWSVLASTPGPVGEGGALVSPDAGEYLYAFQGSFSSGFWRYSIVGDTWELRAPAPAGVGAGGALGYPGSGDFIYAFRGGGTSDFWRYSISTDTWTSMVPAPATIGSGGSLVSSEDGTHVYGLRGGNTPTFWRYSISGNSWISRADAPAPVGAGGALAYPGAGPFFWAIRGDGTSDFWWYQFGSTSLPPTPPTALSQVDPVGGVPVPTGGWINDTQIELGASSSDPDPGNLFKLQFEVRAVSDAFTSPLQVTIDNVIFFETAFSSSNAAESLSTTVTPPPGDVEYHWQVRAIDTLGSITQWRPYPQPVPNGENPPTNPADGDFGLDTSAPLAGTVNDGPGPDVDTQSSLTTITANWTGFADPSSGIPDYAWAIGTFSGGDDVQPYVSVGTAGSASNPSLTLVDGTTYYVSIRATNGVGMTTFATSDGITVNNTSDTTPPLPGTVNDGPGADIAYQASTTTLEANWSGFSDPESGISGYEWAAGTTPGAADVQPFVAIGTATSAANSSLSLAPGSTCYVTVRATNGVGLQVTAGSNGVVVDPSPPAGGMVNDGTGADIDYQTSMSVLSANWSGFSDPETGIAGYEWAIGTSPGATDVRGFASVGSSTSASDGSMSLGQGTTYFVSVRATSGSGLQSIQVSDGVTVDASPPGTPVLIAPAANSLLETGGGIQFSWTAVPNAVRYGFQLSEDPGFTTPLILDLLMMVTEYRAAPLPPGTYYWRVFAENATGNQGAASPARTFTTAESSLGALYVDEGPSSFPDTEQVNSAQDLSLLQLRLTAGSAHDVRITSLRITGTGSGDEAGDVLGVRLYLDVNSNGVLDPGTDELIAGPKVYTGDDGTVTFGGLDRTVPANQGRDWIVVYSLSGNASLGSTFTARLAATQDLAVENVATGTPLLPAGSFPISGGTVTVVSSGIAGGLTILPGPTDLQSGLISSLEFSVPMLQFHLAASSVEPVRVTGIVVQGSGTGDDAVDISSVILVRDTLGDGVFNAGVDPVIATSVFTTDDGVANLVFSRTIPAGGSETWLVLQDANGSGTTGATFMTDLHPGVSGTITTMGLTSGLPVTIQGDDVFGPTRTIGTYGVDPATASVTNVPLPPSQEIPPFAHGVPVAAFDLSVSGLEDVYVLQVRIRGSGTGNEAADVARARLWEDADSDGIFSPTDVPLASLEIPFTEDDGTTTFVLSRLVPAGETRRWFVTYDFLGSAARGTTFQVSFSPASPPPAVVVSGVASGVSILPSGTTVIGPRLTATGTVGSSGDKDHPLCAASVASRRGPASTWIVLAAILFLVVPTALKNPCMRRVG